MFMFLTAAKASEDTGSVRPATPRKTIVAASTIDGCFSGFQSGTDTDNGTWINLQNDGSRPEPRKLSVFLAAQPISMSSGTTLCETGHGKGRFGKSASSSTAMLLAAISALVGRTGGHSEECTTTLLAAAAPLWPWR
jgi:hypothetical protein